MSSAGLLGTPCSSGTDSSSLFSLESLILFYVVAPRQTTAGANPEANAAGFRSVGYRSRLLVLNRSLDCLDEVIPKVIELRRTMLNEEFDKLQELRGAALTPVHRRVFEIVQRWRILNMFRALRSSLELRKKQVEDAALA